MHDNSAWQVLLLWLGTSVSWFGGESGRILVASGTGGLIRWLGNSHRKIRDGLIAIVGGALIGSYLWPAVLQVFRLDRTPDHIYMAAFISGTLGMSLVKVLTAIVESRLNRFGKGQIDGSE